jgi:hypothetical protein
MKNNQKTQTRPKRIGKKQNKKNYILQAYGPKISSTSFQPRWMDCDMKYCDQFTVSIPAGSVIDQIYRANSLFDPDRTNVGHQPRGFDQLTPLYNRYRVDALKWEVKFMSASFGYNACVIPVNGAQTYTTIVDIGESSQEAPIKTQGAGATGVNFSGRIPLWQLQGRSATSYHTDDVTAAVNTTNPVETIDFHIVVQNFNLAALSINYVVTLTYESIWFDFIIPGQS